MLGYKLLLGALLETLRLPAGSDKCRVPTPSSTPLIPRRAPIGETLNILSHRDSAVSLVVQRARDEGDPEERDVLTEKNDTTTNTINICSPHIKPQVDLGEVAMPRHTQTEHLGIKKLKRDQANEAATVEEIKLNTSWQIWLEHAGWDLPIYHQEVGPARGEKGSPAPNGESHENIVRCGGCPVYERLSYSQAYSTITEPNARISTLFRLPTPVD